MFRFGGHFKQHLNDFDCKLISANCTYYCFRIKVIKSDYTYFLSLSRHHIYIFQKIKKPIHNLRFYKKKSTIYKYKLICSDKGSKYAHGR